MFILKRVQGHHYSDLWDTIPINITETIGAGNKDNVSLHMKKRHKYWFPPNFVLQEDVVKYINRFCIQIG